MTVLNLDHGESLAWTQRLRAYFLPIMCSFVLEQSGKNKAPHQEKRQRHSLAN